ncbi:MAG TPA: hypothetical protein VMU15_18145 [Anaeromyxobacter sp.]|nr:hypothetical protein [Anaeromyxobacter sp.]
MRTAHVLDHLVLLRGRRHGPIHVHLPLARKTPQALFARMAAPRRHDGAALLFLALLVGALAVAGVWMAREVGRGMVIAERCGGDCVASVQPAPPGG